MENLVILQPIKRVVKGAGWTRFLYLVYLQGGDQRNFAPVILNADEAGALIQHLNRGGSVAVDGEIFNYAHKLESLAVEGREMTEYRRLEGNQRAAVLQAEKDKEALSAFLKIKGIGRKLFLAPAPDVEPRVNYASVA